MAFIGRKNELQTLRRIEKRKRASLVVVTGRRRIGKSRLVEEFAKNRCFYSFSGLPPEEGVTAQRQREEFIRQMGVYWSIPPLKANDWGALFLFLAQKIESQSNQSAIILFDEISWMGDGDPLFLGQLKIAWDLYFKKNPHCLLIFCGSVSTWIEENILSSTGFFGRITHQIHLTELSLQESHQLLKEQGFLGSAMECLLLISVTGGVPWYLELIDSELSAENNIKALCFSPGGILVNEFHRIFHDLFRARTDVCRKIVENLANGSMEYKTISEAIHYPSGGPLSTYLEALVISGYVMRDVNWSFKTVKDVRIERYRLKDNYLRFYLKYIEPYLSKIQKGHFNEVALSSLSGWQSVIGLQFENLVLNNRAIVWKALGISPTEILNDNPYCQRKTKNHEGCQIDYLIQTKYNTFYVCEIKFTRNALDSSIMLAMKEKLKRFKKPKAWTCIPVFIHVNGVAFEDIDYPFKSMSFLEFFDDGK